MRYNSRYPYFKIQIFSKGRDRKKIKTNADTCRNYFCKIKVDLVFFVQIEEWSSTNILASVLERISNDENQIVQ